LRIDPTYYIGIMKKLKNKIAVVYGNGATGNAIAKGFAREGAKIFLAGRTPEKLKAIADNILFAGGHVEIAEVDALDEPAVEKHMSGIIEKTGKIDISFNTIGIPQMGVQGIPLTDLSPETFALPINTYAVGHFITAKAAAKRMIKQGSGVIMIQTPNASRISPPFVGGMVPAWAAMEALCRSLSVECGPYGVRTICLQTTALPETPLIDEVFAIHGDVHKSSYDQFKAVMESMTHRNRLTTIDELVNSAVFAASDEGSALTGTNLNLTAGMIVY